jgi:hypothetical protein
MLKHHHYIIPILAILILATLIILTILASNKLYKSYTTQSKINSDTTKTFYKCNDKHNPPMENILTTGNYSRVLKISSSPGLYLPCGYNDAELELYNLPRDQVATSKIFAISGCDILAGKDTLWQQLEKTYSRDVAKGVMPECYLTGNAGDMDLFERTYHTENIYILKKNIQRKRGIIILNNLMNILDTVKRDPRYVIIQHYISNPYLIKQRKLNIRLYVAVVCYPNGDGDGDGDSYINSNGYYRRDTKVYLYPAGKCIYSNQDYNPDDITNLESHLTSLNLDVGIYSSVPHNLTELEKYIGTPEYNIIWNKIIKKMGMIMQAVKPVICQDIKGRVNFQLFGVDVMLDSGLEPWILEFNKGPDMTYKTTRDKAIKEAVYRDLFAMVDSDSDGDGYTNASKWIMIGG